MRASYVRRALADIKQTAPFVLDARMPIRGEINISLDLIALGNRELPEVARDVGNLIDTLRDLHPTRLYIDIGNYNGYPLNDHVETLLRRCLLEPKDPTIRLRTSDDRVWTVVRSQIGHALVGDKNEFYLKEYQPK